MRIDELTGRIIGAAIEVHRNLGPGLLESTYEECLAARLEGDGLRVERQIRLPLEYLDRRLERAYRMDMRVEGCVVVEVKAVAALAPVHFSQLLTYLKLSGCTVGLLINFNVPVLKRGIRRVVLDYMPEPHAEDAEKRRER